MRSVNFQLGFKPGATPSNAPSASPAFIIVLVNLLVVALSQTSVAQEPAQNRKGHLIRVPLPINYAVSEEVRNTLKRIAGQAPRTVRPEDRPIVVLEFDTGSGKTGKGSEQEACQALARALTSAELNRIETIAYIARSKTISMEPDAEAPDARGRLSGHAILVAIAANRIAMEPGTVIGKAGADEPQIDRLLTTIYQTYAERRARLPVPLVLSLLDPAKSLFRVSISGKPPEYYGAAKLEELERSGQVIDNVATLSKAGEDLYLSAEQLSEFRLIQLTPDNKNELARELAVDISALETSPLVEEWTPLVLDLGFRLDQRVATWAIKTINRGMINGTNLVILELNNNLCDNEACFELAQHLADLDPGKTRTVAFVRGEIQEGSAVVALSCDHLIMAPNAKLGGFRDELESPPTSVEVNGFLPVLQNIARAKETNWSMMMAMMDPTLSITSYRGERGQTQLLSDDEYLLLDGQDQWKPRRVFTTESGLNTQTASELELVRLVAEDMGQVQTFYQLEELPVPLQLTATDRWVDRFASFLRFPFISMLLLMGTFFFLSSEMSAPGLGLPGFLGVLCATLFFWSMYLGGSAEWFEILMFIVGIIFLLMEIFVVPGFGIFGIGGLFLIGASIMLSSQTFIIPRTAAEFNQIPYSLLPIVGAGLGVVAGFWVISKALPHSPFLKNLILDARRRESTGLEGKDPEAIVDWSFLKGEKGKTVTRLNPAGKAKLQGKVYDVISTGQLIDKGESVVVVEAIGNRIVVQAQSAT